MAPEELAAALQVAEIIRSQLPPRHRGGELDPDPASLGPEFEELLDLAKRVASPDLQHEGQE